MNNGDIQQCVTVVAIHVVDDIDTVVFVQPKFKSTIELRKNPIERQNCGLGELVYHVTFIANHNPFWEV